MSKVQKLKKTKKKMSPETKETLSNAFKGIISNQCCVDGGKNSPWWVALIFLCLSIILPLIPIMVSQSKTYGASTFAGYNYGVDQGIHNTFTKMKNDKYSFRIEGNKMRCYLDDVLYEDVSADPAPLATDCINIGTTYETYNFNVYWTNLTGSNLDNLITALTKKKYEVNTKTPYDEAKEEEYKELGTTFYTPSFMILNTYTMGVAAYKQGTTTIGTSTNGGLTWTNTPDYKGQGDFIDYVLGDTKEATYSNFKKVLNETFLDQKAINFRNNTLIYFGVYAGLILFLGLLVFILTRGKNNVFHYLSFFKCQRIAWWASFTPALLGMIFAFIFSTNMIGQMSFVIFEALRIMWLSMRQLKPVQ